MPSSKNKGSFALFCLITSVIEEAVLVAVLLWVLPLFGIRIPIWLLIGLVLAWAGWSYLTYRLGQSAIGKTPAVGSETMIGTICQTTTPLCPVGYVQVGTELWRACSVCGDIGAGAELVIIGIKGLTLFVSLPSDASINKGLTRHSEGTRNHDSLAKTEFLGVPASTETRKLITML
jgi:membrane protein implicated in regulation of membrane protease activity